MTTNAPISPPDMRGDRNDNPPGVGFWALVAEDLRTHSGNIWAQGFWALFNHRFGNWRMSVRPGLVRAPLSIAYRIWAKLVQISAGIDLPYTTRVGRRVKLEHFGGMVLIARAIGDDVTIRQNTTFGLRDVTQTSGHPTIGEHADIGVGAVLLGDIKIGAHAVIGANAVVLDDVPPYGVAVGAPARLVKLRQPGD